MTAPHPDAAAIIDALRDRGLTVATAESLTGGALCSLLVSVPGASDVVKGSVVAYDTDVKHALLGVPTELLEDAGPVSPQVAREMAAGARDALAADVGVSTTGVAGPDPHDGLPAGTVIIAVALADSVTDHRFEFTGERNDVRAQAVDAALVLVGEALSAMPQERP